MVSLPTKFRQLRTSRHLYLQAAEDALHRLYLTKTPPEMVRLPTTTFPEVDGNIFTKGEEIGYRPGEIGTTEVQLGSAGRSGIIASE
jgi:large subunit ribosomal protein L44